MMPQTPGSSSRIKIRTSPAQYSSGSLSERVPLPITPPLLKGREAVEDRAPDSIGRLPTNFSFYYARIVTGEGYSVPRFVKRRARAASVHSGPARPARHAGGLPSGRAWREAQNAGRQSLLATRRPGYVHW